MSPINHKINRVHRSAVTTTRHNNLKEAAETSSSQEHNRKQPASSTRLTWFMRSVFLCFAIAGLLIVRYPSFIQHNTHSEGDIVVKLDDIITPPLTPERKRLQGLDHYYMFPPQNVTTKGILIYLHSCQQSGLEFFILPEHRIIAHDALQKGMIVFSPTSYNRKSGCFTSEDYFNSGYLEKVVHQFISHHKLDRLPRVGMGDSSGGEFLSFVHEALKLESMAIYNSPQGFVVTNENEKEDVIPTVYLTMSSDGSISTRLNANKKKLREMNISTYLYKVTPRPFTDSLCAARLPELPLEFCEQIFRTIKKHFTNLLDVDGFVVEGDVKAVQWQRCFKKLESDYRTIVSSSSTTDNPIFYGNNKESSTSASASTTTSAQYKSWLRVILEQEIQSCHGFHAMTAQFHDEILKFLMSNAKMDENSEATR